MAVTELAVESLPGVDALRRAVGWGAGSWFLEPMIGAGGCMLGTRGRDGELEAMGATALFEPFGFICNMVVQPALKRRGMGREVFEALLGWLQAREIDRAQLEATEEGRRLYEQYGFVTRWESVTASRPAPVEPGDEQGIQPLQEGDWPEIAALDRTAYGGDRSAFLRALAAGSHTLDRLVLREGGQLRGFGMRFPGRIGPLVAADEAAAEKLARALAFRAPVGTFATVGHPMHGSFWERLGFEIHDFDARMAAGPPIEDEPGMVFSMLNGGVG